MRQRRLISLSLFLLLSIRAVSTLGQEIKNDTIYVSDVQVTTLLFPSRITVSEFTDESAYSRYNKRIEGTVIFLRALARNTSNAILNISEGKRNHVFIIVYKPELSLPQLEHNWESVKALKNYVAALALKPQPVQKKDTTTLISAGTPPPKKEDTARVKPSQPDPSPTVGKEDYNAILIEAYKLFNKGEYTASRKLFEQALLIKPDERIAKSKIEDIDLILAESRKKKELEKERQQKEEKYKESRSLADIAFNKRNYEEAEANYSWALTLKPNDAYVKSRLAATRKMIDDQNKAQKDKELEERYQKSLAAGKVALDVNNLEEARAAYQIAADTKPADTYARSQVKTINKKIEDIEQAKKSEKLKQEKKVAYDEAIASANQALSSMNYGVATEQYSKAYSIVPDAYPRDQLKKIEKIVADSAQKLIDARTKLVREKQASDNYKVTIKQADKSFALKDYATAKGLYKRALVFKDDPYPKLQITEIDNTLAKLAAEADAKKAYDLLVTKAKAALKKNDYNNARKFLEEAVVLKPDDQYAKSQLEDIYKKLDEIAKAQALNARYDSLLSKAAQSMNDLPAALQYYKEAGSLKPTESYPAKMVKHVEGLIANEAATLAAQQRRQEEQAKMKKVNELMARANSAILDKRWEGAKKLFNELLALNPSKPDQEFANKKIEAINLELARIAARTPVKKDTVIVTSKKRGREKQKTVVATSTPSSLVPIKNDAQNKSVDTPPNTSPSPVEDKPAAFSPTSGNSPQKEAILYSRDELLKKYPNINFDELPPGQTFNPAGRKNRSKYFQDIADIVSDKGGLNLYDSVNHVRVICQNIVFNQTNTYIKLLIQNLNPSDDFLTGTLQLRLIKSNGTTKDLNQLFISDFPVVMPDKEFPVIYVADGSVPVNVSDNLVLEMNDRSKKTTLKVRISGQVYNKEKQLAKN